VLKQNGLPDDLKYAAIVESALQPHIGSSKGALGFWQFIKDTGIRYGLTVNADSDERRNIVFSTEAAASYFKSLYTMFNSWTLALAAYNMGEYGLETEILLQGVNDYYLLHLPLETQQYVLRIFAVKLILSNPVKYGYSLSESDLYGPLEYDRELLEITDRTPISVVAEAAGTHFKVIRDLNPEIRGYYLPQGVYTINIPKGGSLNFQSKFAELYAQWLAKINQNQYTVVRGDTLTSIANRFNVTTSAISIWNNLDKNQKLLVGRRLIVLPSKIEQKIEEPQKTDGIEPNRQEDNFD
jgi:hypothetical protein